MPTLQDNLAALVNFLSAVDAERLGPTSSAPSRSKRAQPQSEEATNHSRALLLFTDLFTQQPDKTLVLNKDISNAFAEMASTPDGRKKLEDALAKMELVLTNYKSFLFKAFGVTDKQKNQFHEAVAEFRRSRPAEFKRHESVHEKAQTNVQVTQALTKIKTVTEQQLSYLQSDLSQLQKNYNDVVEKRKTGFTGKAREVASHFFKRANPDRHSHDIERMLNQVNIVITEGKQLEQDKAAKINTENQIESEAQQNSPSQATMHVAPDASTNIQKIGIDTRLATGEKADALKKEVNESQTMGASIKERAAALLDASTKNKQVNTQPSIPNKKEYQENLNRTFYATIAKLEDTFLKALKVSTNDPRQVEKRLRELQKDKKEHMFLKLTAQTLNSIYAKYDIMLTQTPERQDIKRVLTQVMDIQNTMAFKT